MGNSRIQPLFHFKISFSPWLRTDAAQSHLFHVYRRSSSGPSSGALSCEYTLPRCGDLSRNKLASPPVLPRCVHIFHFSIFIYYACIILAFLHFANSVKNSVSQFRIHLLLHLNAMLIRMQNIGVFVRSCECNDVSHI